MQDLYVNEYAVIDEGAKIGKGSKIWHFSHVCADSKIGENVIIGQNVFIAPKTKIGDRCKIQNNVSVYEGVILEEDVFCGPSMVFTNVYNPRAFVERKKEFRQTLVKKGAAIGANATIVCGATLGEFCFIGAGAVVKKDVPAFAIMAGVPARQVGWMSRHGVKLDLPVQGQGRAKCAESGIEYILDDTNLTEVK